MGNKSIVSPLPSYEVCSQQLSEAEMLQIQERFKLTNANSMNPMTLDKFFQSTMPSINATYFRKYIYPRLFAVIDVKKDQLLDMEEYVCASTMFRLGKFEDHVKVLFVMYDGGKGGIMTRDNLRQLIVDATICIQKEDIAIDALEKWIENLHALSDVMADSALAQFSNQPGKIDFQDFFNFVKVEGSIQQFLTWIPSSIGEVVELKSKS